MEEQKYIITLKIISYSGEGRRVWELIDSNATGNDTDLKMLTFAFASNHEYNDNIVEYSEVVHKYRGSVFNNQKSAENDCLIIAHGQFPTKLFEALESQFPDVEYAFWAISNTSAFRYVSAGDPSIKKICCPTAYYGPLIRPLAANEPNFFFFNGVSRSLGFRQLDCASFWIIKELSFLPDEDFEDEAEIWDPLKSYSDDYLKIDDDLLKRFFPLHYAQKKSQEEQEQQQRQEKLKEEMMKEPPAKDKHSSIISESAKPMLGKVWKRLKVFLYIIIALYILLLIM